MARNTCTLYFFTAEEEEQGHPARQQRVGPCCIIIQVGRKRCLRVGRRHSWRGARAGRSDVPRTAIWMDRSVVQARRPSSIVYATHFNNFSSSTSRSRRPAGRQRAPVFPRPAALRRDPDPPSPLFISRSGLWTTLGLDHHG